MTAHHCHAHGCTASVPPRMFMCKSHWYALRKPLRDAIWHEYKPGQERDKSPSARYMAVQRLAIAELAFRPYDEQAARVCVYYMQRALRWQAKAIADGAGDPLEGLLPAKSDSGVSP